MLEKTGSKSSDSTTRARRSKREIEREDKSRLLLIEFAGKFLTPHDPFCRTLRDVL